jgi:Bacterial dnaA  protein
VLEASLPVPIQPPYLERMVAVLRKRAEQAEVTLPKDVAFYLAQNIRSSTKALEGALLSLIAHASTTGTAITLASTRQVLKHFIDAEAHKVLVAQAHNLLVDSFPKMRPRPVCLPSEQSGTIEANIRPQDRVGSDQDFGFWLQTRNGRNNRRVRHELEVNLRESERERLSRWDAYERGLERRAKTRKQG